MGKKKAPPNRKQQARKARKGSRTSRRPPDKRSPTAPPQRRTPFLTSNERRALRREILSLVIDHSLSAGDIIKELRWKKVRGAESINRMQVHRLIREAYQHHLVQIQKVHDEAYSAKLREDYNLEECQVLISYPDSDAFYGDAYRYFLRAFEEVDSADARKKALCIGGGYTMHRLSDNALRLQDRKRYEFTAALERWRCLSATAPEDPKLPDRSSLVSAVTFRTALGIRECRSATVHKVNPVETEKETVRLLLSSIGTDEGYCSGLLKGRAKQLDFCGEFLFNVFSQTGAYEFVGWDERDDRKGPEDRLYSVFSVDELRSGVKEGMKVMVVLTGYESDRSPASGGVDNQNKKAIAARAVLSANKEGRFITHLLLDFRLANEIANPPA